MKLKKLHQWVPTLLFLFSFMLIAPHTRAASPEKEVKVSKIWDGAPHSAFTDLMKFRGHYYCSFREGSGHVPGTDGVVRILRSKDARKWEPLALLASEGVDLRDPKLSVTPGGKIMVIMGGSIYRDGKYITRSPRVSFSDRSGHRFSSPEEVLLEEGLTPAGDWIWRVTWHRGTGYAIDYQTGAGKNQGAFPLLLVSTHDGKHFRKVSVLPVDGTPNEATIRFDASGQMVVMIRRESADKMGMLATSVAPYTGWTFTRLNYQLGGPNFIFTPKGSIIAGARIYESKPFTGILTGHIGDPLELTLRLPSGGDNSYPGLALEKKRLLVSYYSSHEGKTAIYLADIPISLLEVK